MPNPPQKSEEFTMPNNNPHGHNQYTKSENRSAKSQGSRSKSSQSNTRGGTDSSDPIGSTETSGASRRGFASMDEATQREIASKGGHSQGRENNPGNFANDRDKAREAGRKGGEAHGSHR